jgi:mannose-6-phosphate isomerase-like protein (cupin superfamily)
VYSPCAVRGAGSEDLRRTEGSSKCDRADRSMKQIATVAAAVLVAFGAGFGVAHLTAPAAAASVPMTPQVVDLGALTSSDLAPSPGGPNVRAKGLVSADGATIGIQIGTVPKHYHADANEIQYVIDGTGTEWLGDKQVALKPGIMLIIPKGTPHGGSTETSGHLKIIAIKTPPQAPDDTHPLP